MSVNIGTMRNALIIQVRFVTSFSPHDIVRTCFLVLLAGELEVNEEEFADHDENCHGPMDTPENRRDFPEGFTWTCCEADGASLGCEVSQHVSRNKKRRMQE